MLRVFDGDVTERSMFGTAVAGAGDVDGDGFADVIVGMPAHGKNGIASGAARLFSGRTGKRLHTVFGDGPGDALGEAVGAAGDVNQDGYDDFLVGAKENRDPVLNYGTGYAKLYSGRDAALLRRFGGSRVMDEFGAAVGSAGDVDADGTLDVYVASLLEGTPRGGQGSVRVFSGKTGVTLRKWMAEPGAGCFGMGVAVAGDVNRDGRPDLAVGSINPYSSLPGTVWVFSGRDGATLHKLRGPMRSMLGMCVAAAGDVDRDGYPDIMGSDPSDMSRMGAMGSVKVFSGRDGSVLQAAYGPPADQGFGMAVAATGDLDRDGIPELVSGAYMAKHKGAMLGKVSLFSWSHVVRVGAGCSRGPVAPTLGATHPSIGKTISLFVKSSLPRRPGLLVGMSAPELPVLLGHGCAAYFVDRGSSLLLPFMTDPSGRRSLGCPVPADPQLIGARFSIQAALGPTPHPLGFDLSNGVYLRIAN
ncbi:MAG: FG-GAP-like repeat-containing protein [Planctomycetota bacterium]